MVKLALFDRAMGSRRLLYGSTVQVTWQMVWRTNSMEDKQQEKERTSDIECIQKKFSDHFAFSTVCFNTEVAILSVIVCYPSPNSWTCSRSNPTKLERI